MTKLATTLGIWGATLGMLAGLIELGVGSQIRPWIGNKENPAVLGLVTMLLSGMALAAVTVTRRQKAHTNDGKLAIFLGVLFPAVICFTTVGRLWYLPGTLLVGSAALLAYEFWIAPPPSATPGTSSDKGWRLIAGIGSLMILGSIGMAFWNSRFGLFQAEVLSGADRIRFAILPIDFVRRTALANGAQIVANVEVSQVMIIYILLILGAVLAFIASLTASRFFAGMGGGIVLIGLILCLIWLPGIMAQAQYADDYINLIRSLGWGWYLATAGMILILASSVFKVRRVSTP
jgi:hypothetical protein